MELMFIQEEFEYEPYLKLKTNLHSDNYYLKQENNISYFTPIITPKEEVYF